MGAIRTLYTDLKLRAVDATKGLVAYDKLWKQVAKSVETSADLVERAADRAAAAMARMAEGAAVVRSSAGGLGRGGGGGGGAGRAPRGPNPATEAARAQRDAVRAAERARREADQQAARDAKENARIEAQMARQAAKATRPSRGGGGRATGGGGDDLDRAIASANRSESGAAARMAGLASGAREVREATAALGAFASKSDRARAAVDDLTAQVARNRKEMADLRAEAVRTGDSDGTLAERMKGLSASTAKAQVALAAARRELRAVDGGLIETIRNTANASANFGALRVALGSLIASGVSRIFHGIAGGIADSTKAAIEFESAMADVKKVLPDGTTAAQVDTLEAGLLRLGPAMGILPTDAAQLTAELAQAGIAGDQLLVVAEDAARVGVAFDLSGKEAGHAIASIQAALGTTRDETNSLFDSINELSNGMNSTAAQLVEVEERVGSVGRAMSLSGETVAALGSALVSTGASADVAATGVRTFLARLGAGAAATPKQLAAFDALGLSATETAKALSSGDMQTAEGTIRKVVKAIQDLPDEDRLPVLIELFGSESIGTIGALATNVELLGTAFEITGNKTKAAGSVQREFENRSKTTEHQLERVKAGVQVLAIELGNAFLPMITRVAEYLNSPEGQAWGREQVEGLVGAVQAAGQALQEAWPVVVAVGGALASFVDTVGGATVAVGLLGAALLSVGGPFVATAAVATAAGAAIGQSLVDSKARMYEFYAQAESNLADVRKSLAEGRGAFGTLSDILVQMGDATDRSTRAWAAWMRQMLGAKDALEEFYASEREAKIRNGTITEAQDRQRAMDAKRTKDAERTDRARAADSRARAANAAASRGDVVVGTGPDQERFAEYSARVRAGAKLKPSEAKDYKQLSKRLDLATATKAPKGRTHKATKMDQRLAALDPSLAGVLRQGGESDAGGDLKVSDDLLSKAVYNRQAKAAGESGLGGGGGIGPGPNTTNNYTNIDARTFVTLDARSTASIPENIRGAATDLAAQTMQVRIRGVEKLNAARAGGGVIAG